MSSIRQRITPHIRDIGFPVRRLLPDAKTRSVGPFVFLDHMGPATFQAATTAGDVRAHPHIGLATITYLFSGAIMHRDSLGSEQRITPGDVNWMSAGRGIVHSERIPSDVRADGCFVEGLQMWVALPQAAEEGEPVFRHVPAAELPRIDRDGVSVHVLLGKVAGAESPLHGASPTLYAALDMQADSRFTIDTAYTDRAIYVVGGSLEIVGGDDGGLLEAGTLAVLEPGADVIIAAHSETRLMLVGGEPLDGPRTVWWNFVTSDKNRLEAAKLAWANQDPARFPKVPGEIDWIPLPER